MRAGRRQFLQTLASTTVVPAVGCSTGSTDQDGMASSGASSNASGGAMATGATNSAGGAKGGTESTTGGTNSDGGTSGGGVQNSGGSGGTPDEGSGGETNEPPLSSPLGIALLGLGNYSKNLLAPALQLTEHCKLVGIVTGTPSKIPEWQMQYGIQDKNVYSYDTMDQMLDNPDIHVVYIVTPNHVHAQYAIAAARAKKHVWCEKPMAMTAEECQSIINACNENGVTLSIGYRMQHEPNTQTIVRYASEKPYGAIDEVVADAGFSGFGGGNPDVWRLKAEAGGGALFDMGVYCINAARYATGEEPLRVVSAQQWTDRPQLFTEVDEWTEFELEFPSGAIAYCRTSFGANINLLEVSCADGSYKLEPMQSYTGVRGETSDGTLLNQTIENQQTKQMDDDALAILEKRAMLVPGEEGLRDVRIVQAIVQSAQTGQPVDIG